MITIRIFDSEEEVKDAQKELKKGGFESEISEDKFDGIPIQEFNVPARFRLKVKDDDFEKVAQYLGNLIKKSRLES